MKKIILSALVSIGIISPCFAQESWSFFPINKEGFEANYAVAPIFGSANYDKNDDYSGASMGVEFSMNSLWIKSSVHEIRDQLSLKYYDHHGDKLTTLGFNPHYMFDFSDQFQLGVGPSLQFSYINSDATSKDTLLHMGVGGSLKKMFTKKVFFDLEMDYTMATESEFNNFELLWKVGYVLP